MGKMAGNAHPTGSSSFFEFIILNFELIIKFKVQKRVSSDFFIF